MDLNVTQWVAAMGYIGIFLIIFFETAFFLGFFLPGDSLLFAAGYLASKGVFNLNILIPAVAAIAFVGYAVAYWFGIRLGHWLINHPDRFWFKKKYMLRAHAFYDNHGGKAIMLGRLIPVLRTFIPIIAGMAEMNYKRYIIYNGIGAFIWAFFVPTAGYYIGSIFPNSATYLLPAVLVVVLISASPGIYQWCKVKWQARKS